MSRRWLVPLLTAAALALAVSAEAHWSVTTKSCCSFLCKRYKATARATCSAVLFNQQTTVGCGAVSASASRSCIVGGASASSFNGPSGWGGGGSASGLGSYGDAAADGNRRGPGGFAATEAGGTVEVDARNAAILRVAKGFVAAADRGGAHSTLTLTVWLSKGEGDAEVATPENTIWSAEIRVERGEVFLSGDLSAKDVRVEHGDGYTSVTLADLLRFVPVPPGRLADVAFTAEGDGAGTGARIPLDLPAPAGEQTLLDPGEGCPVLAFLTPATPAS